MSHRVHTIKSRPPEGVRGKWVAVCGHSRVVEPGDYKAHDRWTKATTHERHCAKCKAAIDASATPGGSEIDAPMEARSGADKPVPGPGVWLPVKPGARLETALPPTRMEREERPRRWLTARVAVLEWFRYVDDTVPMRSPELDPRTPRHREWIPGGDRAQRDVEVYGDTAAAVREACGTAHRIGGYDLGAKDARQLLEWAIAGKAVKWHPRSAMKRKSKNASMEHAGETRKKTTLRGRERVGDEWIARAMCVRLTLNDGDISDYDVRQAVRDLLDQVTEYLGRRGRVLRRDGEEAESMAVNKQKLLRGWRSIAAHLDWSVARTMRAQEWTPPIPVRVEGVEYVADADALDAWREAGPQARKETGT